MFCSCASRERGKEHGCQEQKGQLGCSMVSSSLQQGGLTRLNAVLLTTMSGPAHVIINSRLASAVIHILNLHPVRNMRSLCGMVPLKVSSHIETKGVEPKHKLLGVSKKALG